MRHYLLLGNVLLVNKIRMISTHFFKLTNSNAKKSERNLCVASDDQVSGGVVQDLNTWIKIFDNHIPKWHKINQNQNISKHLKSGNSQLKNNEGQLL